MANQSSIFGMMSILFGFLAFAAAIGHFFAGPLDPPPPVEVSIAEKAVDIRDATIAALKGEEYETEAQVTPKTIDDYITYGLIGAALVAILLAIIGFVRHENLRANIAGAALGGLAITFQVAIMLFFAALFVFLLTAVLDKLDFGLWD